MHTKNLFHYELKSTTMFLTNNYKTLKLRNSDVGEMGWNPDHWLKHEVVKFGDVLKDVLTNGEFHLGGCLALKDQQPTMEEVLFILEIDHTTKLDCKQLV